MANTKPRKPVTLEAAADASEQDYTPPDLEFMEKRDELANDGGGSVNVYREGPGGHKDLTFVKSFALTEFEPAMLQAAPFNGGRFRIHMRGATGLLANFLFKVETLGPKPGEPAAPNAVAAPSELAAVVVVMREGFEKMLALMAKPQGSPLNDALAIVRALKDVNPAAPAAQPAAFGMFAQLGEVLDVVERLRGSKESDGSILGALGKTLDKIAEPLGNVLAKVAEKKLGAAPGAAALLAAPAEGETVTVEELVSQYGALVLGQARANKDPGPLADMILENAEPNAVAEFLNKGTWFAEIVAALPDTDVLQRREWFEELRQSVLDALAGPPESDTVAGEGKPAADATIEQPPS